MRNFVNAGLLGVVVLAAGLNACGGDDGTDGVQIAGGGGSTSAGGQANSAGKGGSAAGASGAAGGTAGKGGAGGGAGGKGGAGGATGGKGGAGGATGGKGGAGGATGGKGGAAQGGAGQAQGGAGSSQGGAGQAQGGAGAGGGQAGSEQGGAGQAQGGAGSSQGGAGSGQAGDAQGGAGQAQGGAGSSQGGAGSGQGGNPPSCTTNTDCDDKNPCTADSCDLGACTNSPTNGPLEQLVGDCKVAVCDNGQPSTTVDTKDVPQSDPNGCTIPTCGADGTPATDPRPDGTVCSIPGGSSGVCEGGVCGAGCVTNADCDDKNDCTLDTCTAGKCSNAPVADGTPDASAQDLPGDCKSPLCQGGLSTLSPNPKDVPDDMNPCTADSCDAGGNPVFTGVTDGTACGNAGDICIKSACVAPSCGDGVLSASEACDGANLNGKDCTAFGFVAPAGLACSASCALDQAGCKAKCGNGVVEPGEECDDKTTPGAPGGGCSIFCTKEPTAGQLIITEILFNPEVGMAGTSETGEWFEVYNTSDTPIDMRGLQLSSIGTNELHIIASDKPLVVMPKTYVVFAQTADTTKNDGITPFYAYGPKIGFNNGSDDNIRIEIPTSPVTLVDAAGYAKATASKITGGKTIYRGVSYSLNPTKLDSVSNDSDANFCPATSDFGVPGMNGVKDKGTPGAPNDPCP
jgi:cysteine-rich repeat protein